MNHNEELINTSNKAIELVNKIQVLKDAMKPLEEELEAYKEKLKRDMGIAGVKEVPTLIGNIKWIDKSLQGKLDTEAIMKALEVDSLAAYRAKDKLVSYIKITPKKG